jgi:carboxyl-terminal processing protease
MVAALVLTFVVGIGVGRAGPLITGGDAASPVPSAGTSAAEFDLIRQAWDTLHREYVARSELDDQALAYGAINGLTQAVGDTGHTSFLTPEDRKARAAELSGSYVGIGVRIDAADDGRPLVVGVFKDSPAEAAGVLSGDIIVTVDEKTTTGHDLDEVASWIRGEAGSTVDVTVRAGTDGPDRTYTITRADVPIEPVEWTLVPGTKTAFLHLDSFSNGSADDVVAALKAIKEAGADRLILDLRGNPGGFVNEAVGIASQFIGTGDVYIERDADGNETHHPVSNGGVALDLPMVVLVDKGTASAAEILSGALQDAGRATIEGVTTFGTGTVLGEFELSDGSALRIGTVEWLTPEGRRIWHEGIVPGVVVERPSDVAPLTPDVVRDLTPAAVSSIKDPQLTRALSLVASAN